MPDEDSIRNVVYNEASEHVHHEVATMSCSILKRDLQATFIIVGGSRRVAISRVFIVVLLDEVGFVHGTCTKYTELTRYVDLQCTSISIPQLRSPAYVKLDEVDLMVD